jgi:hypothetical protein
MSLVRTRVTIPVAALLAVATVSLLAGCFGNPVHSLVKDATGGTVDVGGSTVPSDFPKAVPLYKGTVATSAALGSGKKKIWNVGIDVPAASAMDTIKSQLTASGFTTDVEGNVGKVGASLITHDKTYGVAVVLAKVGKGYVANYTVTPDAGGK